MLESLAAVAAEIQQHPDLGLGPIPVGQAGLQPLPDQMGTPAQHGAKIPHSAHDMRPLSLAS